MLSIVFLHILLLLFKGDFVKEGSYFYDVKDTMEWKWETCAVTQRSTAKKKCQSTMGLELVTWEIVLHTALPSELSISLGWANANSVFYPKWVSEDKYMMMWNVINRRICSYRWHFSKMCVLKEVSLFCGPYAIVRAVTFYRELPFSVTCRHFL